MAFDTSYVSPRVDACVRVVACGCHGL